MIMGANPVLLLIILSWLYQHARAQLNVDRPTNVMAMVLAPRSIQVTWTPSSSPDVTGYLISYTTTASYISINNRSRSMLVGNVTNGILTDLEEGTTYTITVQATASNNIMSGNSNEVIITTYTAAPSSPLENVLVTSVDPASLMVSWQPPPPINHNGPITAYMIQYTRVGSSDMMSVYVNSGTTQFTILRLVAYVDYSVTVAAMNVNGTGPLNSVVQRSGQDVPTAPRSLMIVDANDTTVTIAWMPPDPPNGIIIRYQVQYRRNDDSDDSFSDNEVNITATDLTDLTYTVTGLMTATLYRFRVTAFTIVGRGDSSNFVNFFVGLRPPTNVRVTELTPRSVQVTWTLSTSPDVTGYLISYTTDASYISMNDRSRSMPVGNTRSGILNNLEEGTTYTITVQATAGNNRRSGNINAVIVTTCTTAPSSPPLNIIVTSVNPSSLMVSWQPPPPIDHNGPITGHVIRYTRVGSSDMMSVIINSGTTEYIISRLVAYVDYSVTVAAMNVNGTGPLSNPMVNRSGENRPSEPQLLSINSVNSISVMLQWGPPATPNGVIVLYSLKYNSTTQIVTYTSGDVLMYTVGGLSSENVYVFQVTAHTGAGEGPPASIVVVIPPSPISDVTIFDDTVTSSALTLSWTEVNLTNSVLVHFTVFYLPVSGPYDRIMASNKRKRQSAQPGEFNMNFTETTGTLTNLNGSVTYMIQVAAVVMLNVNGQIVTGDRSTVIEFTTLEGVPTAPRNLNYTNLTISGITLTWNRPDPPNGLITQYNTSYSVTNSQCEMFYNFTILPITNGDGSILSFTWIGLIQGRYQFSVVASTSTGPGESASLMLSILPSNEANSDGGSDDDNGVIIALATLLVIAVIGLVISVVIIAFLVVKLKQLRYDVDQSDVRYSDVKQSVSRNNTITESNNKYINPSEPEYEAIDTKPNMKPNYDVMMDANPAYQTTS